MIKLNKSLIIKVQKKLKLDNKKILYLVIVCLILILLLDLRFILRLQIHSIKNLNPKIIKLKEDLNVLERDLMSMRDLKKKLTETNQKMFPRVKKIISAEQISDILQVLSDIANKNEVKIAQMKPVKESVDPKQQKAVAVEKFTPLLITLDLFCGYHQLGHFINDLENAQIFFAVQEIKIAPQQTDFLKQKAKVVLKTYVRK